MRDKKAFTLVELIITITILAILGTIAYISFQGFVKDARDGTRLGSIRNIEKGVEISFTETGKYPQPDLKTGQTQLQTGALSISGSIVEYSYLGEIGQQLTRQLRITKTPTDPLTQDKYTYATTIDGKKYQVASILENPTSYKKSKNLINQANAANGYVAKVSGNHEDIVIKSLSNGKYITVVPSIVFDTNGSNILNQSGTLVVVNNKQNLPYSPDKSISLNNTTTAEQIIREIRGNNQATTVTLQIPSGVTLDGSGILNGRWNPTINKENTNWKLYSTGAILASLGAIDPVTGGADYTKLTAVLNGQQVSTTPTTTTTASTSSYNVGNSLMFNGSSNYLSRVQKSGDKTKWSFSTWVKRSDLNSQQQIIYSVNNGANYDRIGFTSSNKLFLDINTTSSATNTIISKGSFNDPSKWYNIVGIWDGTNLTQNQRMRLFVDGVEITSFDTNNYPTNTTTLSLVNNDLYENQLGRKNDGTQYFGGYLSDINFIDGQILNPTSFGQFDSNGRWVPIQYTGSYGTNGFHLDFSSGSNLGYDSSLNGNNWNLNGGINQANNQMIDNPTNNFATLNPLNKTLSTTAIVSNGNLTFLETGGTNKNCTSTIGFDPTQGPYYWEVKQGATGTNLMTGIIPANSINQSILDNSVGIHTVSNVWSSTVFFNNGVNSYTVPTIPSNGTVAFFVKNGKLYAGLITGGTISWSNSGNPDNETGFLTSNLSGTYIPFVGSANSTSATINFGQTSFLATNLPTGYKTLSTKNITYPIEKPKDYFDVLTYTGNGSTQNVTGLNFQPDLVWIKDRTRAGDHVIVDSIRLLGTNKVLSSNATYSESSYAFNPVTSFNSNGFSLSANVTPDAFRGNINGDGNVAWNWRQSTTSGFKIISFTKGVGNPEGFFHDLGKTPAMFIVKDLDASGNWHVRHKDLTENTINGGKDTIYLNSTAQATEPYATWYGTGSTTTTPSIYNNVIPIGHRGIGYLWSEIPGFSKFGSYTGNGSATGDGPFIYTGFKPRYVMVKRTDTIGQWLIMDSLRDPYNVVGKYIKAENPDIEMNYSAEDFLSNGFKLRTNDTSWNALNGNYIYAAFAELHFK